MINKKLGYFDEGYVRQGKFIETAELPEVNFSYRPLNNFQTAALVTLVMDTQTIEDSQEQNLKMASKHIVDWDMVKRNPKYSENVPEGEAPEQEFVKVDFTNINELKKISPIIMNFILNAIRGDSSNPFLDKAELDKQLKNL